MQLFELPPEILQQIFAHIEPSWFRANIGRFTISRAWYDFAVGVCYRDFIFSQRAIYCLASCPDFARNAAKIQRITENATICLRGFDNWKPSPESWSPLHDSVLTKVFESLPNIEMIYAWYDSIEATQKAFSELLQKSQRLRNLCVVARIEGLPREWLLGLQSNGLYLGVETVETLCSIESLRSLTLDLYGIDFACEIHPCGIISKLLTTLYSLKLRLPLICAELLTIPKDYKGNLKLFDLVINMSLSWTSGNRHLISHLCPDKFSEQYVFKKRMDSKNLDLIRSRARILQAQMAKPSRLSILKRNAAFRQDPSLPTWTIPDIHHQDNWTERSLKQGFGSEYEDLMQSNIETFKNIGSDFGVNSTVLFS